MYRTKRLEDIDIVSAVLVNSALIHSSRDDKEASELCLHALRALARLAGIVPPPPSDDGGDR